ncbi:MAG: hypothetical protein GC139_10965 [Sideroxydans sp.]|nr:hypothetical protein [Sideroxydans sp.]
MYKAAMNLQWRTTYAELTPAELGEVAGVPPELQRVWRKRGYLPALKDARARFDVFLACEVMLLQALALRGIPPSEGASVAKKYAHLILFAALIDREGPGEVGEGACEVIGPKDAVEAFVRAYDMDTKIIGQLAKTSFEAVPEYLVALDDRPPVLAHELPDEHGHLEAATGAFVNLMALGLRFAARFGKPLVSVEVSNGDSGEKAKQPVIRRLLPRPKDA